MKKINILYWICTIAFSFIMVGSAIPSIRLTPESIDFMGKGLGYPNYFILFTGIAKVLGIIAILIPGFPRIKEWAYAGLIFDLIGAIYSIISIGQPGWQFILIPLTLGILSYYLYHRRLARVKASDTPNIYSRDSILTT
ncbi:MAG TPA: DoxX family protein [Flavitalea sp.]|nr:DoxX family protein [Flavitalea sp.]